MAGNAFCAFTKKEKKVDLIARRKEWKGAEEAEKSWGILYLKRGKNKWKMPFGGETLLRERGCDKE